MRRYLVLMFVAAAACRDSAPQQAPALRSASVVPTGAPASTTPTEPAKPKAPSDKKKGDKSDEEWVPAEFKTGVARWKDTGVYLDGKPIAFLTWGELPIGLKPTWVKDKVSTNKRAGTTDLGWRWGQQRRYRFTDYLVAMGIDPKTVKELHVYGPRFSNSVVATTKDLVSPAAKDFQFRFGGNVHGKAIPQTPPNFGHGRPPDKIAAVMIYIEKKPPTLTEDGFVLDDRLVENVPYYGDPLRGGVRVYLDNRLAAIIKRQELDPAKATKTADGELEWKLGEFLAAQGVDTSKLAEMWVVRGEKREEKLAASELAQLTFRASPQAKGGVLLGGGSLDAGKLVRANVLSLHTVPVSPEQLPFTTADDD